MKTKIWLLIVLVSAMVYAVRAQDAAAPATAPFKPNEIQLLRLQVKQRDAKLAQIDAERAVQSLAVECHKVRDENKWPATVECDFNTLTFIDMKPPAEAAKPEAPKPPPVAEKKKK